MRKIKNFLKENWPIVVTFAIVFALLLTINLAIPLFFDDYGYGSLSYGYDGMPEGIGTDWSFSQLMDFLKNSYLTWSPRIIPFFVLCLTIKNGPFLFYFLQSIVILSIIILLYKIIKKTSKLNKNDPLIIVLLFMAIQGAPLWFLRDAMFWAAASVAYIWPLLPISIFIYLIIIYRSGQKKLLLIPIFFVAILSSACYEQYSIFMVTFCLILLIYDFIKKKKWNFVNLGILLAVTGATLFVMLAPGNFVRIGKTEKLPLMESIFNNFSYISSCTFKSIYYPIVLIILFFVINHFISRKKEGTILILVTSLLLVLTSLLQVQNNIYILGAFSCLFYISFFVGIIVVFREFKIFLITTAFYAATFSPVVAPYSYCARNFYPQFFLYSILLSYSYVLIKQNIKFDTKAKTIAKHASAAALSALFLFHFTTTTISYYQNKMVFDRNDYILKHYNGIDQEIVLYKNINEYATQSMPYYEDHRWVETWVRKYYKIPQYVKITYIDWE